MPVEPQGYDLTVNRHAPRKASIPNACEKNSLRLAGYDDELVDVRGLLGDEDGFYGLKGVGWSFERLRRGR